VSRDRFTGQSSISLRPVLLGVRTRETVERIKNALRQSTNMSTVSEVRRSDSVHTRVTDCA